jgi:hypothetical protein
MMLTMLALGPFRFGIGTAAYEDLARSRGWVWAEQEVIGAAPKLQFTGAKAEAIQLRGTIFSSLSIGGRAQLEAMAVFADRGKPMLMVSGPGLIFGFYVIEGIDQSDSRFTDIGAPKKVEFTITLKKYADTKTAISMMINDPASIVGFGK